MAAVLASFVQFTLKIIAFPLVVLSAASTYLFGEFTNDNGQQDRRIWWILGFFFWSSLAVTVFAIGGIITLFVALIYVYIIAFKKIKCINKNIPMEDCV